MNAKEQIKYHYEEILSEALNNTDIWQKTNDGNISALSRKTFNDEVLKLYKPQSKDAVTQLLNEVIHPILEEKAKKTLSLTASLAMEDTLKIANCNNEMQICEILKSSIDKTKSQLVKNHNDFVQYRLDAEDIRRGEKAFYELVNVDVPEVILNKVAQEINNMVRENPQGLVNFSESSTV